MSAVDKARIVLDIEMLANVYVFAVEVKESWVTKGPQLIGIIV